MLFVWFSMCVFVLNRAGFMENITHNEFRSFDHNFFSREYGTGSMDDSKNTTSKFLNSPKSFRWNDTETKG